MTHADRKHARLAPSSAERWMNCPGSVQLCEGLEEAPSVFAAEGTAAHQLAEVCLDMGYPAKEYLGESLNVGQQKFIVDQEMVDGVQLYLDVIQGAAKDADYFEHEQRVDVSEMVPGTFGTLDAFTYSPPKLSIFDLKYGKGVPVEVHENKQLLTYALGIANRLHNRGVDEVELVIVQPRAPHSDGPVRRWSCTLLELYEHAIAAQQSEYLSRQGSADRFHLKTGEWCKFCRAAAICPALSASIYSAVDANLIDGVIFNMADPTKYNSEELAHALKNRELIAGWLRSLETFSHFEATRGRCPPGYKLVAKKAHRKWIDEGIAQFTLSQLGLDDAQILETKMRSPAQVEKELPKGNRSVIAELASNKTEETTLAPLDDKRPAVDPADAGGAFEAVDIEERD